MDTFRLIREFIDVCSDIHCTIHLFILLASFIGIRSNKKTTYR